jgi:hypothetical protein
MDQASFFQGLLDGKCAIDTVSRFDASEYTCQIAAQVSDALSQLKVDVALWANFDSHDLSPVASVELLVPFTCTFPRWLTTSTPRAISRTRSPQEAMTALPTLVGDATMDPTVIRRPST